MNLKNNVPIKSKQNDNRIIKVKLREWNNKLMFFVKEAAIEFAINSIILRQKIMTS